MSTRRDVNQAAFLKLKPSIDQSFPYGRYVAIDDGQIVADAGDIRDLERLLSAREGDSRDVLVVQAGHYYPEYVHIFI